MNLLLVGSYDSTLSNYSRILEKHWDVSVSRAKSGEKALEMISRQEIDLVIADKLLGDTAGLEFAEKLTVINPMINCAVVNSMSAADFHEASEGLGILAQLPDRVSEKQVEELLQQLRQMRSITGGKKG